jgi:DMSO/TMAO reductase YedYZ molybdopterin-dependent catalytic subunit
MERSNRLLLNRRSFLAAAPVSMALALHGQTSSPALITRERSPENLEFPFASLDSFITPNEKFYVRCHFPIPKIEAREHRIRIEGAVNQPFEISHDELRKMSSKTVTATLECAGNSRVLLVPAVAGAQWEMGAVSNAEWAGVPLAALLEKAGVKPDAVDVVLEGADEGEPRADPKPPGGTPYLRSISIAKARRPEVVIAYGMNGKDLPVSHGFPVRAVVPGYYGMSSVKWLKRIRVVTAPYQGYFQTTDYAIWDRSSGVPVRTPLLDMRIKSLIARPTVREVVQAGSTYRVHGAAWTGDADVNKVEFSGDGGKTWLSSQLIDKPVRFAWRRWEQTWKVPAMPGRYTLMSKATDTNGNTQSDKHDRDTGSYAIHHTLPIEIDVV